MKYRFVQPLLRKKGFAPLAQLAEQVAIDNRRFEAIGERYRIRYGILDEGVLNTPVASRCGKVANDNVRLTRRGQILVNRPKCYEQEKCGELVDKRELGRLVFHEPDHKPNPYTPESDEKRIHAELVNSPNG